MSVRNPQIHMVVKCCHRTSKTRELVDSNPILFMDLGRGIEEGRGH